MKDLSDANDGQKGPKTMEDRKRQRDRDRGQCNMMESGINQSDGTGLRDNSYSQNAINVVCRQRKREGGAGRRRK